MSLNNKTVMITGAAGGLGRAMSLAFARQGTRLVLCDIAQEPLDAVRREVEALQAECIALRFDVGSSAEVTSAFARVAERFNGLDVLIKNAAVIPVKPIDEKRRNDHYAYLTTPQPRRSLGFTSSMTDEDWRRFWDVNVHGVFYCIREALKVMEPQRSGKIVNIASIAGLSAFSAHSPHYSATKGAMIAFTRSVAAEVAGANIFVNAIAPGGVHTEMFEAYLQRAGEQKRKQLFQLVPLGRLGTPEEYASLAVYLADDGHYLVGQIISPNGGMI